MQFSKDMVEAILAGRKTQTRRPWKEGDEPVYGSLFNRKIENYGIVGVLRNGRTKWQLGKTYAVQPGRGKPAIGRMELTCIRCEEVLGIPVKDAIKEGFMSREGFFQKWDELYPSGPYALENNPLVWMLEFELVEGE